MLNILVSKNPKLANVKYNPLINLKQAEQIYNHYYKLDDLFGYSDDQMNQDDRAITIVALMDDYTDSLTHKGVKIHLRTLLPVQHKLYASDIKKASEEINQQIKSIKLPNIKHFVNPENHNRKLNYLQIKNYLLRSAKVYGNIAYHSALNDLYASKKQKDFFKKYSDITKIDQNSYYMSNNFINTSVWIVSQDDMITNLEGCMAKELMDINFARSAMFDKSITIHQSTLDSLNNSILTDCHTDGYYDKGRKPTKKVLKTFNLLNNLYEESINPLTNRIDYSLKERQYAKKIEEITQQILDNSAKNTEQSNLIFNHILTSNDTKNWNNKDKQLFKANQDLWSKLYRLGVVPIPEYTPGRVTYQSKNITFNRIGKMSYIIKHVAEGDFTKKDLDEGLALAKKRQKN